MNQWTISSLLVKVVATCNLKCSYCFWFRDPVVKTQFSMMPTKVMNALMTRLDEHLRSNILESFHMIIHGGEPLLFGKKRMRDFLHQTQEICHKNKTRINFSLQTNGSLIDSEWCQIFREYSVSPGVSLDGPPKMNDQFRKDHHSRSTYEQTLGGIKTLQETGFSVPLLAVCNPNEDPEELVKHFVEELGINTFDILMPDFTHDEIEKIQSVAAFYVRLFDLWIDKYRSRGVRIRSLELMVGTLLGFLDRTNESIGYGPMQIVTVYTDGKLGATDSLGISNYQSKMKFGTILDQSIDSVKSCANYQRLVNESLTLSSKCMECEYALSCGGGMLAHRYSSKDQSYRHPSVYCNDLLAIFKHIQKRVERCLKWRIA